jgi:H+/Na+-translocating ferredoxin:NAD+ oxidoreductase subunit G
MTHEDQAPLSSFQSAIRAAIGLGLFAILTAGLVAIVQLNTKERIVEQETKARLSALYELLPESYRDNDLLADSYTLIIGDNAKPQSIFLARRSGVVSAIVLPWTAPDGYTAPIQLLVAIDVDGELIGVRVVSHKETPGLGDNIELAKSDWILGFDGRSIGNTAADAWAVKKDGGEFDQLTGATITPRAIVAAVYDALQFFETNKTTLLNQSPQAQLNLVKAP